MRGVVMIADISGFTKMAEHYCTYGEAGVEKLSLSLNVIFSLMIDTIEKYIHRRVFTQIRKDGKVETEIDKCICICSQPNSVTHHSR